MILAIETSCDETGVAIVEKKGEKVKVISQAVASQIDIHKITGGVVPEVAAREHVTAIKPLIEKVLAEAGGKKADAIAVTYGPGLVPALSVGVQTARTLAFAWDVPIIPVHHIEGHIYSALLQSNPEFPALALIVSGGHTQLIKIKQHLDYEIIGSTRDDAVGEAFDKVARLLDLPYPGGPEVSKLAEQGNPKKYNFPRPMINSGNLDFSFSGLKTAVLYKTKELGLGGEVKQDIAASFQKAIIDTLIAKTKIALGTGEFKSLLVAGGVAANIKLREAMQNLAQEAKIQIHIAPAALCGDNGVMIGMVAAFALQQGRTIPWQNLEPQSRPTLPLRSPYTPIS